jgi:hypothetical protein
VLIPALLGFFSSGFSVFGSVAGAPGHAAWELSPPRQCHPLTFHARLSRQPIFQG